MGSFQSIVLAILTISFLTFVALFGHALRNTPIGALHRLLTKKIPRWLLALDRVLTRGCLSSCLVDVTNYITKEKHPLVIILYLTLMTGGMYMFYADSYQFLSPLHKVAVLIVSASPYYTLYKAVYSDPGFVTPENHSRAMELYPFDNLNFFPDTVCRTCNFVKPARSKHCSLCRRCVSKMDHHCVWINNCVGHSNTRHFFAFIVSTTVTLWYGAYLTGSIITQFLHSELPPDVPVSSLSWGVYLRLWLVRACFPSYFLSYPIHQSIITPFGQGLFLGPLILSPPPSQLSLSAAPSSRWPTRSTASNSSPASSPAEKIAQSMHEQLANLNDSFVAQQSWMLELTFIGAVFLLCVLCGILAAAFTIYHVYLIYAGTTTNESSKWSDWKEDIDAGEIYRSETAQSSGDAQAEADERWRNRFDKGKKPWPRRSRQVFVRLDPSETEANLPRGHEWVKVKGLSEVDNIYDLGFKENMRRVLWPEEL